MPSRRVFLSFPAVIIAALVAKRRKSPRVTTDLPWLFPESATRIIGSLDPSKTTGLTRTLDVKLPVDFPTGGRLEVIEIDSSGTSVGSKLAVERQGTQATWVIKDSEIPNEPAKARLFAIHHFASAGTATKPTSPLVKLLPETTDEDDGCFVIETPMFTAFFQKRGSALSSLIDRDGNDWINYRAEPGQGPRGSYGAYRGIPNFPAPPGMFHPGHTSATTTVVSQNPLRIELSSKSNQLPSWAYQTVVYADRIEMTVLNAPEKYWWLFEGTPGGEAPNGGTLDFRTMRSGSPDSPATQSWSGKVSWVGFRVPKLGTDYGRTLIAAHTTTSPPKSSYYLANGVGSPVGAGEEGAMTVFGFGRDSGKAFVENSSPQTFTFSMIEAKSQLQVENAADFYQTSKVRLGPVQTRPTK